MREQIVEVMAEEQIHAHADDVVVTCGSQQALDLVTRMFCDPGDVVLAEAPSYVGALGTFRAYQCEIVHVAMDEYGIDPEALRDALVTLRAAGKRVKFLYTIPNFQNPTGVTQTPRAPPRDHRDRAGARPADRRGQPVRPAHPRRRADAGAALDGRRQRDLPGLVLQDLRPRLPGRLGARAARRPREAGAHPGGGHPVPAGVQPVRDRHLPRPVRLARPDRRVPRHVPRTPRRDAGRPDRPHARGHHLDAPRRAASSSG